MYEPCGVAYEPCDDTESLTSCVLCLLRFTRSIGSCCHTLEEKKSALPIATDVGVYHMELFELVVAGRPKNVWKLKLAELHHRLLDCARLFLPPMTPPRDLNSSRCCGAAVLSIDSI